MGPGAEPVEEDYFQDEPVNVAKRFVGVAGEGTKRRGWARRRENNDWVGRSVGGQGEMWVSGVCVGVGGSEVGGVVGSVQLVSGYKRGRQEISLSL